MSKTTIYRLVALGRFPAPVRLGPRFSAWCEREVDAWIAELAAARRLPDRRPPEAADRTGAAAIASEAG